MKVGAETYYAKDSLHLKSPSVLSPQGLGNPAEVANYAGLAEDRKVKCRVCTDVHQVLCIYIMAISCVS